MWANREGRRRSVEWRPIIVSGIAAALLVAVAAAPTAAVRAFGRPSESVGNQSVAAQTAGAGKAYVGLFKDNGVAVLDLATQRVLETIAVPPGPHGLVATPDGSKVFVSSDGASTVSVIDPATDRVVDSIEVGPTPHGLAISADGQRVLVSGFGTDQAEVIDTSTDQIVGRVPVPQPHNSAISPDGQRAYVGSQKQGQTALVVVDLNKMIQTGRIPLDQAPRALSYSPDGRWVYFTLAGSNAVQVLDTSRNEVVGQIPVGVSPHLATFTPDGQLGLVVAQGPGELDLVDPARDTETAAITVGTAPHWLATSPDGRRAFVTNENSNDVSIVDLVARQVIASVPVGNAPRKIAVVSGTSALAAGHDALDGGSMAPSHGALDGRSMASESDGYGGLQTAPASPQSGGARQMTFNDHGTMDVSGLDELDLEADDNYFSPTFLRGAPGQKLKLVVENEGSSLHNVSIPGLGVDLNVAPHASAEVEVTFPPVGSTVFSCKFHTALGMNGALLVGDATP